MELLKAEKAYDIGFIEAFNSKLRTECLNVN